MEAWGQELPAAGQRPGLVVIPADDPFTGGEALARRSATRAGAQIQVLDGLGHWWMVQDPARGARVLADFLSTLE
jgi:pimeloyl-ACP methyl ester carboxylesterase